MRVEFGFDPERRECIMESAGREYVLTDSQVERFENMIEDITANGSSEAFEDFLDLSQFCR